MNAWDARLRFMVFFAVASLVGAGDLRALTLADVVDSAFLNDPGMGVAVARHRQAEAGLTEVGRQRWPSLRLRSEYTRGNNPVYVFGSLLEQGKFGPANFDVRFLNDPPTLTKYQNAVEMGVPLFTGFEMASRMKMQRLAIRQSEKNVSASGQRLRLNVAEAYLGVLLREASLAVLDKRIVSAESEVADASGLRKRGLVLGSDYYAAEAILNGLKAWRAKTRREAQAARAALALIASTDPEEPIAGSLRTAAYDVPSADRLREAVSAERPELEQARLQEEASDILADQSARRLLPTVEAYGAMQTNTADFESNPSNGMLGVRAVMPIGDPAYFVRKKRARHQHEEMRRWTEGLKETFLIDAETARAALQGALESVPLLSATVENAVRSLELFRPLYREGRQSILDLLRAEEAAIRAEINYLEAIAGVHTAFARLQFSMGRLDEEALAAISEQLEKKP